MKSDHFPQLGDERGSGVRVLECLQRALKIADACASSSSFQVSLFVDILDDVSTLYDKE